MEIYQESATSLLSRLRAGELSSVEIVQALIARIERHNSEVNAIIQPRYDEALDEAAAADRLRGRGEGGALCGLPMTIKENLYLRGTKSTIGLSALSENSPDEDAVLVDAVRDEGVVILGKTNVPQLLLAQETENAIWGLTPNPWHSGRSSGGSSGGESAAIASGFAPFGLGSDIGGSIRIPCHFTGLTGLKPTVDRWSNRGMLGAAPGQELVRAQSGPMARTVDDLILLWNTLDPVKMSSRDAFVPPLPTQDPAGVDLSGMRIGWFDTDGFVTPTGAVRRGAQIARAALEAAGATVVDFEPIHAEEVFYLWLAGLTSDDATTYKRRLSGEAFSAQLSMVKTVLGLPKLARAAVAAFEERRGNGRVAKFLRIVGRKPVEDYWDLVARRSELRREVLDSWNEAGIDAVVCPPHATPAMGHRESADFAFSVSYMFRYSLLNYPAGVVPVTRALPSDVTPASQDADRIDRKKAGIDADSVGLPVGVQVVARPYREDIALAVMKSLEQGIERDDNFPITPVDPFVVG